MKFISTTSNRREWFRHVGRLTGLAGLAAGGSLLAWRSFTSDASACTPFPQCRGCHALKDCTLPQAISSRTPESESSDE